MPTTRRLTVPRAALLAALMLLLASPAAAEATSWSHPDERAATRGISDASTYAELTRAAFDTAVTNEAALGRQPVDIEVRPDGTSERFAVTFFPVTGTIRTVIQADATEWQNFLDLVAPLAGRWLDVEVDYFDGAKRRTAVFLEDGDDYGYRIDTTMTDAELIDEMEVQLDLGRSIIDIEAYEESGETRFAAIWVADPNQPKTTLYHNLENADFIDLYSPLAGRVIDVERYDSDLHGEVRYAAIYAMYPGAEWAIDRSMSAAELDAAITSFSDADTHLIDLDVWVTGGGEVRYSGIWGDTFKSLNEVASLPARIDPEPLGANIATLISTFESGSSAGVMGLYAKNLATEQSVGYRADEMFYIASSAKVAIHIKMWMDIVAGRIARTDTIFYTNTTSSGANWYVDERPLPGFDTHPAASSEMGMAFPVTRFDNAMMSVSDNGATSALVDDTTLGLAYSSPQDLNEWLSGVDGVGQGWGLVTSIHDVDRTIMWQGQQNATRAGDPSYFTVPGFALEARWRKTFDTCTTSGVRCEADAECSGGDTCDDNLDPWGVIQAQFGLGAGQTPPGIDSDPGHRRYYAMGMNSSTPRAFGNLLEKYWEEEFFPFDIVMESLDEMDAGGALVGDPGFPLAEADFGFDRGYWLKGGSKGGASSPCSETGIFRFGENVVVAAVLTKNNGLSCGTIDSSFMQTIGVELVQDLVPNLTGPDQDEIVFFPDTVRPGDTLYIVGRFNNVGGGDSPGFDVEFRASAGTVIDGADPLLHAGSVGPLDGGGSEAESTAVVIPASLAPGTYNLGWIVDPGAGNGAVGEWDEDDNTGYATGTQLTVLAADTGADCNSNGLGDECDLDCSSNGGACNVPGCGMSTDCDGNLVPDECDLAASPPGGCSFPTTVVQNTTTADPSTFQGPPDDVYFGLGGQQVTYELDCGLLIDGPGADFTVYEVDAGGAEFAQMDVLVSENGFDFVSVKAAERPTVAIPGDETHGSTTFARSYDLRGSGLSIARFVRIDGNGDGPSGTGTGFDLDAIGLVNTLGLDCNANGTLDACDPEADCNGNGVPESCELAAGLVDDCDGSLTPDTCDTLGGVDDCDGDTVPDVCEPDCNGNATPDDCDIAAATSADCNGNAVPDECDLALTSVTIESTPWMMSSTLEFEESFETPDTANFTTYGMGDSIVTAAATWLVTATGVDLYEAAARPEAAAYDGAQAIDLTGSPGAGVIETTLPTTPGQAYELVFHYARNDLLGAETGDAQVDVEGTATLLQATIRHDPADHPFDEYLEYRGFFVADDTAVTLRFTSLDPGNTGITLDGIAVSSLASGGEGLVIGGGFSDSFPAAAPFPAAGDVSALMTASSDLGASNEYVDLDANAVALARFFETGGQDCAESSEVATIAAGDFNVAVGGGPTSFGVLAPSAVNAFQCESSYATVRLTYTPIVDCNANGNLDQCEIASAASTDLNLNGIADDCETDCNGNAQPDDYDIAQGLSADCNLNGIPDECDAGVTSDDCNSDGIPDECQADCNSNGVADDCDLASMTSDDCNGNAVPDECDLAAGAGGCPFPVALLDNGTTGDDAFFLGPPDGVFYGLGGQVVTYEFDCGFVVDGPGPDFNVYEVSAGSPEFGSLDDVLVSADGITFVSVLGTEGPVVRIPGDEAHTSDNFVRSYDLFPTGLNAVRFVRLDGVGTGNSGSSAGFDLDAVGAINRVGVDCDTSGVLDVCESFSDCNANGLNDDCEIAAGIDDDCNMNGDLDACDIVGGAPDVDADQVPDECEPDCNVNMIPDDYDIAQGTESDCNDNLVPDTCDLADATSTDCNLDSIPDECPVCPTVEVVFVMDTSSSMTDEGSALCAELQQVVAELEADLVDVETELLGILSTGGATFSCLTDTVGNLYGTAVPGSPPAGQEVLGEPCGANLNEDWGPATAIVAGLRPWLPDSVRVIVPIGDEGPRCGNPVNDPGDDRDSILNAIGQADAGAVIVSPIAGSGSSAAVIAMADLIAGATGGTTFESTDPETDLAEGIRGIIESACFDRSDCNANGLPDDCDLDAMTSADCDMSGTPDECEDDCNGNGLADSCDIASMTSLDENMNTVPDECEAITLLAGAADWTWTATPGALGYDLVRGDLVGLRSTAGDYGTATDGCLANDHAGTDWPLGADPVAGEAYWYLVRGVLGGGPLSYDGFGSGLTAGRDAGIAASGVACP